MRNNRQLMSSIARKIQARNNTCAPILIRQLANAHSEAADDALRAVTKDVCR
jgi:hypothetical protein